MAADLSSNPQLLKGIRTAGYKFPEIAVHLTIYSRRANPNNSSLCIAVFIGLLLTLKPNWDSDRS